MTTPSIPPGAGADEREAFEAWFCADGTYEPEWIEWNRGLYTSADTENMWQAWQARANMPPSTSKPVELVAWEAPAGYGIKRFISDRIYRKFHPNVQRFYKPFKCASCATPPAAPLAIVGAVEARNAVLDEAYDAVLRMGRGDKATRFDVCTVLRTLKADGVAVRAIAGEAAK